MTGADARRLARRLMPPEPAPDDPAYVWWRASFWSVTDHLMVPLAYPLPGPMRAWLNSALEADAKKEVAKMPAIDVYDTREELLRATTHPSTQPTNHPDTYPRSNR